MPIYLVDDGAEWYFDAQDHDKAKEQWLDVMVGQGAGRSKAEIADFEEPEISLVQLTDAAKVKVRFDDEVEHCSACAGTGRVARTSTVLDEWRRIQSLPDDGESRPKNGVICCSEW